MYIGTRTSRKPSVARGVDGSERVPAPFAAQGEQLPRPALHVMLPASYPTAPDQVLYGRECDLYSKASVIRTRSVSEGA